MKAIPNPSVRIFMVAVAFLLFALGSVFLLLRLRSSGKAVATTRVQRGSLELDVNTVAELRPARTTSLVAPPVNGTLQIIHLRKTGTPVKAGDTVVEFDTSEQEFNLDQDRSKLAEAEQEIVKADADAEVKSAEDKVAMLKAKFDLRRAEVAVQGNELVSAIDAKKNLLALDEAKRHLAQLEEDVSSRTASNTAARALLEEKRKTALLGMQQAQQAIDMMTLKAPIDGLVSVSDNLDANGGLNFGGVVLPEYREGDLVNYGRTLAEVLDVTQMQAVARVLEDDRPNINVGQLAEVRADADPHTVFQAKVKTIAGMTSSSLFTSSHRFDVTFDLLSSGAGLHSGMSAQVMVRGTEVKDQLFLPNQCVFDKNGKTIVYVKRGRNFEAVEVKLKFRTENRVAIDNLPENTEVALVDPELWSKDQQKKDSSSSPMGMKQ